MALTFYERQVETGMYQGLTQWLDGFNASSGNAITLTSGARKGRQPKEKFFQPISGLVQSRDPDSTTDTLTPTRFGNEEHVAVKLFHSSPVYVTRQNWIDMGMTTEEGARQFGIQTGEQFAQVYLNSAISALVGSIQAVGSTALHDVSATSEFSYSVLNNGLAKFGDRRQSVTTMVSHSTTSNALHEAAFNDSNIAFQLGSTTIYNGSVANYGLKIVNTDSSPLFVASTAGDTYWVPLLVPGAIQIKTGSINQEREFVVGALGATPANQTWLYTIESEIELKVKGVKWDGADNPNDAALATSGNWAEVTGTSTDVKNGPGVLVKVQAPAA